MAEESNVERAKRSGKTKEELIAEMGKIIATMDPDKFENESDGEVEGRTEEMDRAEVEAIDEMLEGKNEKFNKLKY